MHVTWLSPLPGAAARRAAAIRHGGGARHTPPLGGTVRGARQGGRARHPGGGEPAAAVLRLRVASR
eukprot:scaffold109945_cov33-Phaeocystis_antarctica.AAC.1